MDTHWIDTAIGAEVRAARARVGWTRQRLCAEIGIGPAALQRYEAGARSIPADVLFQAVHALQIDITDIDRAVTRASMNLFGEPWPTPAQDTPHLPSPDEGQSGALDPVGDLIIDSAGPKVDHRDNRDKKPS